MKKENNKKSVVLLGVVALIFVIVVATLILNNNKRNESIEDDTITTTEEPEVNTQDIVVEDKIKTPEAEDEKKPDNNKGEIKKAKGIYDGFIDSHSIEIQLDSGEYQTYLVYDEELIEELSKLEDFEHISFSYQEPTDEGRLPQVISLY